MNYRQRVMTAHTLGADARAQARSGLLKGLTCGLAPDYLQANVVIVPQDLAFDFLRFCQSNPKPCPLLEVTEPGAWEPRHVAPGADISRPCTPSSVFRGPLVVSMRALTPAQAIKATVVTSRFPQRAGRQFILAILSHRNFRSIAPGLW
jgi:uncharacterized protein YcsI (UPF0317 family)